VSDGTLLPMSDEMSATADTGSAERDAYRSAGALTLGLGLLLGGVVVLLLGGWLGAMVGASALVLLVILGTVTIIAGIIQFLLGVYQLADNIDRTAQALIKRQGD
jgi:uncharacterized membrane protein HdeD (DUF308 family)